MGIVYVHTNRVNGKVYVGQTNTKPSYRWGKEGNGYKRSTSFRNAIKKYGWDNFDHQIVATAGTQQALDNLEKVWIVLLQATDRNHGYNLTSGGEHGKVYSIEYCAELSRQRKGRIPWNKGKTGVQVAWNKGMPSPWTVERNRNMTVSDITKQKNAEGQQAGIES